jgi:hypothetical protein
LGTSLDLFQKTFGKVAFFPLGIDSARGLLLENPIEQGVAIQFFDLDFLPHDVSVYNHIE